MDLEHDINGTNPIFGYPQGSPSVVGKRCSIRRCVLHVTGDLRAPVNEELRRSVHALVRRGERIIELDLSRVSRIDAAGIGELVRVYNMAAAVHRAVRITHATAWVQQILDLVGLFHILS
jgi:anti-anti-sigma factor